MLYDPLEKTYVDTAIFKRFFSITGDVKDF